VINTAFEQRELSYTQEKIAIAEAIAAYIPDRSTVFITIGTTVEHIARALMNHKHLRIITNSLRVAHILYKNTQFEVMVPGGILRPNNGGIIGPGAVSFVEGFRADYLITSIGAIESNGELLEFDVNESCIVKAMMTHARHILLAADHTKFHASAAVEIGNIRQLTALFTDKPPPSVLAARLEQQQVEVFITPVSNT
jgi:DeoR/GlpR family transcriptional regulator of sugar metabolism